MLWHTHGLQSVCIPATLPPSTLVLHLCQPLANTIPIETDFPLAFTCDKEHSGSVGLSSSILSDSLMLLLESSYLASYFESSGIASSITILYKLGWFPLTNCLFLESSGYCFLEHSRNLGQGSSGYPFFLALFLLHLAGSSLLSSHSFFKCVSHKGQLFQVYLKQLICSLVIRV